MTVRGGGEEEEKRGFSSSFGWARSRRIIRDAQNANDGRGMEEVKKAGGSCGDAQSRAFVDERAQEGDALDGVADAEAASLPEDEEKEACGAEGTAIPEFSEVHRGTAAVLATEVLRFQCVQPQEEE